MYVGSRLGSGTRRGVWSTPGGDPAPRINPTQGPEDLPAQDRSAAGAGSDHAPSDIVFRPNGTPASVYIYWAVYLCVHDAFSSRPHCPLFLRTSWHRTPSLPSSGHMSSILSLQWWFSACSQIDSSPAFPRSLDQQSPPTRGSGGFTTFGRAMRTTQRSACIESMGPW